MDGYAAVPIARHLEGDVYRIYFSTRDAQNRSFTHCLTLDITEPGRTIEVGKEPVLSPGEPGYFDDSGAMASCVVPVGEQLYMYYIGWNLTKTVPFRNSIGLAISEDGVHFRRASEGPVLDRNTYDRCFTASSCVLKEGDLFRMWYLSAFKWTKQGDGWRHHYHIKYAESDDGIIWRPTGRVAIDFKDASEYAISVPRVIREDGIYKMWYSYRGDAYRIGYAESEDGLQWTRLDERVKLDCSPGQWDSDMVCYPFIFDHAGKRYMLYNGNGYGQTGFGLAVLE
jgi:hypothetical protein